MTPSNIIADARYILNDTDSAGYRQTDVELLAWVNSGMMEISVLRPEWFQTTGHVTCLAGTVEQAIKFSDAQALLRVLCIHDGAALTPFDIAAMDAFNRNWRAGTAGAARQWSAYPGDLLRFYVYPKSPTGEQLLDVLYTRNPTVLASGDTITDVPDSVRPALTDYLVYRAESKDEESVNSGRAVIHYQAFVAKIRGATA